MKTVLENIKRTYTTEVPLELNKPFKFVLNAVESQVTQTTQTEQKTSDLLALNTQYKIIVKKWMTQKSTPSFDFMAQWNNDFPMPFVEMVGIATKETRGMYYMQLHAQINDSATHCMRCGRVLTNPVSRLYGLGPECGGHAGINPFNTYEELELHLCEVRQKLNNITWAGWVIKSSIKEFKEI